MTTKLADGVFNGFGKIKKYSPPKRGGFFTSPRTDTCQEGWGVANAVPPGTPGDPEAPPPDQTGENTLFGTCGEEKCIKRLTYSFAKQAWGVASFPGDQLFGNIDWRGPVKEVAEGRQVPPDEFRPRHVLSWYGPPSRHFPCEAFFYDPENEAHCMLYTGGGAIGLLPYPVMGAALVLGPDRHPKDADEEELARLLSDTDKLWMIVICKDGLNTKIYSKRLGTKIYKADDLYATEDSSPEELEQIITNMADMAKGWDELATFTSLDFAPSGTVIPTVEILEQRTPWFFCESGTVAECIREIRLTYNVLGLKNVQEVPYRTALLLTSETADVYPLDLDAPHTYHIETNIVSGGDINYYTWLGDMECHIGDPPQCTAQEHVNVPADHWWREKEITQEITVDGNRVVAVDWVGDEELLCFEGMRGNRMQGLRLMWGVDFLYFPPESNAEPVQLPIINMQLYEPGGVSVLAAARQDLSATGYYDTSRVDLVAIRPIPLVPWIITHDTSFVRHYGGTFDFGFSVTENTSRSTRVGAILLREEYAYGPAPYIGSSYWEGEMRGLRFFVIQAGSGETEIIPIPSDLGTVNPPSFPWNQYFNKYQGYNEDYENNPEYKYNNNMDSYGPVERGAVLVRNDYTGLNEWVDKYTGDYEVRQTLWTWGGDLERYLAWKIPGEDPDDPNSWITTYLEWRTHSDTNNILEYLDGDVSAPASTYEPPAVIQNPPPGSPAYKGSTFAAWVEEYIHSLDIRNTNFLRKEKAYQVETAYYGYDMSKTWREELASTSHKYDEVTREYHDITGYIVDSIKFSEKQPARDTLWTYVGWWFQNVHYWQDNLSVTHDLNSYDGSFPAVVFPFSIPDPLAYGDRWSVTNTKVITQAGLTLLPIYDLLGRGVEAYQEGGVALSQENALLVSMKYMRPSAIQGETDEVRYYNALVEDGTKEDIGVVSLFSEALKTQDDTDTFRLYPLGPV